MICSALILGSHSESKLQETSDVATARQWSGLAPLPPSTQALQIFRNDAFTWTGYYLKFIASPQEINNFLAASLGLKASSVERFSPKHRYLRASKEERNLYTADYAANSYFFEIDAGREAAPWFDRTIQQAGRRYKISWQGNFGEVVVNDVSHTVYVYVADS